MYLWQCTYLVHSYEEEYGTWRENSRLQVVGWELLDEYMERENPLVWELRMKSSRLSRTFRPESLGGGHGKSGGCMVIPMRREEPAGWKQRLSKSPVWRWSICDKVSRFVKPEQKIYLNVCNYFTICIWVICLPVYVCAPCACLCRTEEGIGYPKTVIADGYEPLCGCWD